MTSNASAAGEIFCIGANHRTADIAQRENFFVSAEGLSTVLPRIQRKFQLGELFVLSTCNRFEMIGVSAETDFKHDPLDLWIHLHQDARGKFIDANQLRTQTYVLRGLDAVRHSFMVAASLDSLVPGETQITGQFREAVELAMNVQTLGPILTRLSQEALATAKKVRSQTAIGQRTVSISHAAVTLAKRMFHDLSACRFLIVGSGEMARVSAEYAASYRPRQLRIANRTVHKAYELGQHLGISDAYSLGDLPQQLAQCDVAIIATSASTPIITRESLALAVKQRPNQNPIFIVDIAMPRNVEPACRSLEDVYLFDIDDLRQVVDQHKSERQTAALQATAIVDQATNGFSQWLAAQSLTPVIEAWKHHVVGTLEREAARTLGRDLFHTLDPRQRAALQEMLMAAAAKLTSDLAVGLRRANTQEAQKLAEAVQQIFISESNSAPRKERRN